MGGRENFNSLYDTTNDYCATGTNPSLSHQDEAENINDALANS